MIVREDYSCSRTTRQTVYSEKCRSWYKMGKEQGRVVALWPGTTDTFPMRNTYLISLHLLGSCLHAVRAIQYPRWEDYNYEYADGVRNRMHWLGDGQTYDEKTMQGDST